MDVTLTFLAAGSGQAVTVLLLSLAALLAAARLLGEMARRFGQPMILGELMAGIVLGPTIFGYVSPDVYAWLFPQEGTAYEVLKGLITLSATFLLLVAGLEVELSVAFRQGKAALVVAAMGMALPFAMGFGFGWFGPELMGGAGAGAGSDAGDTGGGHPVAFAVFVGIALSITALPVIAKILIDLNMFKADLGMLIMSAAILNDLAGWMGFAVVMALIAPVDAATGAAGNAAGGVGVTLGLTLVFMAGVLTLGRIAFDRALPFIQAYGSWPGAVIGFVLVITLLCAAATEAIGIHAIFGAFIAGVAIGDSDHLRQRTRETIHEFITNIFAPIFFASIGLYVNFITQFNIVTVLIAIAIAFSGKLIGCYFAGKLVGLRKRESMAVGFGMVAQGTMGVILGQLALEQHLITEQLFVAIVVVALLTSIAAGPGMQKALQARQVRGLGDFLSDRQFLLWLKARDARQAIGELSALAAEFTDVKQTDIYEAVWRREQIMRTGLPGGIAVPHARLGSIDKPIVVIGRSREGIDFDASDGKPAHIICMLLTPLFDQAAQIELLRLVAEAFHDANRRQAAMAAESYTAFLAAIKLPGEVKKEPAEAGAKPEPPAG